MNVMEVNSNVLNAGFKRYYLKDFTIYFPKERIRHSADVHIYRICVSICLQYTIYKHMTKLWRLLKSSKH